MASVCVVGAGISGVACARAVRAGGHEVEVIERASRPGGRMASPPMTWSDYGDRPVDSGASYFTVRDEGFRAVVEDWIVRGLAREWTDTFHLLPTADGSPGPGEAKPGPMRYAAPKGLRSLVADLAEGLKVRSGTAVRSVTSHSGQPHVDGRAFDAVVLAMPDPQALRLLDEDLDEERAALADRRWEPVLALLAAYPRRSWPAFDGGFLDPERIEGEPVLAFVADDGRRRGDYAPVLVAHSTGGWAADRLDDPQAASDDLSGALDRVLGTGRPSAAKVHRWAYARPSEPREEDHLLTRRRIGFAGDGWGSPKVETAWRSGTALGRHLVEELT